MSWLLPRLIYWFYRALSATWRIEIVADPLVVQLYNSQRPFILAHWHGDELAVLHLVRNYRLCTMTSQSKDGGLIDYVIRRLGGSTSRGSSSRGGISALKGLVRLGRSGRAMSLAVDGPRGPIYQPKPGVFELSRLCSAPIFPVGAACSSRHLFARAWNQAYLPLPFARVLIVIGAPSLAVTAEQDAKSPDLALALIEALDGAKRQAAKLIATP